jgi:hypothetical protein
MAKKIKDGGSPADFIANIDSANEEIGRLTAENEKSLVALTEMTATALKFETELKAANEKAAADLTAANEKAAADLKVVTEKAAVEVAQAKKDALSASAAAGVTAPVKVPAEANVVDDSKIKTAPEAVGLQRAINANIAEQTKRA